MLQLLFGVIFKFMAVPTTEQGIRHHSCYITLACLRAIHLKQDHRAKKSSQTHWRNENGAKNRNGRKKPFAVFLQKKKEYFLPFCHLRSNHHYCLFSRISPSNVLQSDKKKTMSSANKSKILSPTQYSTV